MIHFLTLTFKISIGQYAPFGYVIDGLDIMNDLQAGDVISATYVNEWGKLNLKKIRGTSFANAMSSSSDDDDDGTDGK